MEIFNSKFQIKPTTQPKRTKVLLVCVFNKNSSLITHDIFYNSFSKYGTVEKILIFDKSRIWKTFIEMASEIEAEIAKENLDNNMLLDDGSKMNVYFSNLTSVNFSSSNSGGVDYRLLRTKSKNLKSFLDKTSLADFNPNQKFQKNLTNPTPGNSLLAKASTFLIQETSNQQEEEISLNIEDQFYQKVEWKEEESKDKKFDTKNITDMQKEKPIIEKQKEFPETVSISENVINAPSEEKFINQNMSGVKLLPNHEGAKKEGTKKFFPKDLTESLKKLDLILAEKKNVKKKSLKTENIVSKKSDFNQAKESEGSEQINLKSQKNDEEESKIDIVNNLFQENFQNLDEDENKHSNSNIIGKESQKMEKIMEEAHNQLFDPHFLSQVDPKTYTNPLFLIENRKSKVIYCRGLEDEKVTLEMIYNLFSNFGDILKIIFIRKKKTALIEYETINYASYAREYMNNIIFFGYQLKIFYSNYNEIQLKEEEKAFPQEIFLGNENTFRLKKNKAISINPPSNIVHISNLKKDACTYDQIASLFSPYGKIEGIKYIKRYFISKRKNRIICTDTYKNMCLVKYSSLEESLNAIVFMQNKEINGRFCFSFFKVIGFQEITNILHSN